MKHKRLLLMLLMFLVFISITIFLYPLVSYDKNDPEKFKNKTPYKDYSSYTQATSLAVIDIDRALDLCSKIEDTELKGECLVNTIKTIPEEEFTKKLDICKKIDDISWRSECFFDTAESLFNKNFSLAYEICKKSEIFKCECYKHLGMSSANFFDNISSAISACDRFPNEARDFCLFGLEEGINKHSNNDSPFIILEKYFMEELDICEKISNKILEDECFANVAEHVSKKDFIKGLNICEKISKGDWKSGCFLNIAEMISDKNFSLASEICKKAGTFKGGAKIFEGSCERYLKNYLIGSSDKLSSDISACEKIPIKFRNHCLIFLNETEIENIK